MLTRQNCLLGGIRELFCSLRLTIFLLISIVLILIIGTLLPQGELPASYTDQISPLRLQIYTKLGFFNLYHSWWFTALLSIFSLNLIFCSVKRLPHVLRFITAPAHLLDTAYGSSLSLKQDFRTDLSQREIVQKLSDVLQVAFAKPMATEHEGEIHLFSQKHQWSRLGVYAVHFSILLIFTGAIIGSLFGFSGYVSIADGTSVNSLETGSGEHLPLGFELRCEKFTLENYPNGSPKEFRSILTVLETGQPVQGYKDVKVVVNNPLSYKGISFYQSSYGNTGRYYFGISDLTGKKEIPLTVSEESGAKLPDGSIMRVLETTEDVSRFNPILSGPAAVVEMISPKGLVERFIAYANHPEQNIRYARDHNGVPVIHYRGEQMFTSLKVTRDPGVWWVWSGCFLMMCGLFVAFFLSHKRVWIIIRNNHATIYGNSNKQQAAFEMEFSDLSNKIKLCLQGKD